MTIQEAASESIRVSHGPEGTEVVLEDPTLLEVLGLVLILAAGLVALRWWLRRGR